MSVSYSTADKWPATLPSQKPLIGHTSSNKYSFCWAPAHFRQRQVAPVAQNSGVCSLSHVSLLAISEAIRRLPSGQRLPRTRLASCGILPARGQLGNIFATSGSCFCSQYRENSSWLTLSFLFSSGITLTTSFTAWDCVSSHLRSHPDCSSVGGSCQSAWVEIGHRL